MKRIPRMGKRLLAWAAAVSAALAAGCGAVPASAPLDGGDVIEAGVGTAHAENLKRFDAFLAVTETGGEDAVRIVQRTAEGTKIYIDIQYAGGKYTVFRGEAEDDAPAAEWEQKREKAAECEKLEKIERPDDYVLIACGDFRFLIENWEE